MLGESSFEIVTALAHHCEQMSVEQVARTFFCAGGKDPVGAAAKRCYRLEAQGWLKRHSVLALPDIVTPTPVYNCTPGISPPPQFEELAWFLRSRDSKVELRPTMVVTATDKARRELGGYCGRQPVSSRTAPHDLRVASIYLLHRLRNKTDGWLSEAELIATGFEGCVVPDAMRSGVAVEVGGSGYTGGPAGKLQRIHQQFADIGYEIW